MQELSKIFQSALQPDLIGILSSDFLFNNEKKNLTEKLKQYLLKIDYFENMFWWKSIK